jgi:hypothetical protein
MPKSNTALRKFTNQTPESIERKQAMELVANEFNNARSQVIRRLFDQSALYAELFDKSKTLGNTMIDFTIGKAIANYLDALEKAKEKLDNNESKPFTNIFSSYSSAITAINSYVNSQGSRPSTIQGFMGQLSATAPQVQELIKYALVHVAVQTESFYNDEDAKFIQRQRKQDEEQRKQEYIKTLNPAQRKAFLAEEKRKKNILPSEKRRKEKADKEESDRIISEVSREAGIPEAPAGVDYDQILQIGKDIKKPNLTDDDVINLWLFYENLLSGYAMGQSLLGRNLATVSSISRPEYLQVKKKVDDFRKLVVSDFEGIFKKAEELPLPELNLPEGIRRQPRDVDSFVAPPAGDLPRNTSSRIEQPYSPIQVPRRENGDFVPPPPYSPLGREGIDFNRPPPPPISPLGYDFNLPVEFDYSEGQTGRGKKRGGRQGVNETMARNYELIRNWSGFPHTVPPAKPPVRSVNPRSRVNNRTEANGMPSGSGRKKGKKSGKPKYNDI